MTTAGPNPGSASANITFATWTGIANVFTSNDQYAHDNGVGNLAITGFGFSIPLTATINSITVRVEGHLGIFSSPLPIMWATKNGTVLAPGSFGRTLNFTHANPPDEVVTVAPTLFNTTWTPAEINASTFGVLLRNGDDGDINCDYYVDLVTIEVDYTYIPPVGEPRKIFAATNRAAAFAAKARNFIFRK